VEDRGEVRLLIDTNIFLEVILEQARAEEARTFLGRNEEHEFFLSDFSLHSVGILLFRRKRHQVFRQFLKDMTAQAGMELVSVPVSDMDAVALVAERFDLDFDDAYQYTVAERRNLTVVSFDSDFDRTDRGRRTPAQILQS
jgi:hypothetical protein